jgi:hypothetical protein
VRDHDADGRAGAHAFDRGDEAPCPAGIAPPVAALLPAGIDSLHADSLPDAL